MNAIFNSLSVSFPSPSDSADEETWIEWANFNEFDSKVAGLLSRLKSQGDLKKFNISNTGGLTYELELHPHWAKNWPERFRVLRSACIILDRISGT